MFMEIYVSILGASVALLILERYLKRPLTQGRWNKWVDRLVMIVLVLGAMVLLVNSFG